MSPRVREFAGAQVEARVEARARVALREARAKRASEKARAAEMTKRKRKKRSRHSLAERMPYRSRRLHSRSVTTSPSLYAKSQPAFMHRLLSKKSSLRLRCEHA